MKRRCPGRRQQVNGIHEIYLAPCMRRSLNDPRRSARAGLSTTRQSCFTEPELFYLYSGYTFSNNSDLHCEKIDRSKNKHTETHIYSDRFCIPATLFLTILIYTVNRWADTKKTHRDTHLQLYICRESNLRYLYSSRILSRGS